jgi:hypothetical protein
VFSSTAPYLSTPGLNFTTTTGDGVNLAHLNNGYRAVNLSGGQSLGTFSVTRVVEPVPVPEPMGLALFGVSIAGLALVRHARA